MKTNDYFKVEKGSVIFTGEKLEIFVPKRYEIHNSLHIADTVKTLGFFDMLINGTHKGGYTLAAIIEILPSEIRDVIRGGKTYTQLTLNKGDIFIKDLEYVAVANNAYILFYEMSNSGHFPDFVDYNMTGVIYDYIADVTGARFQTSHSIFELISAQLCRDKKSTATLYRNTPMTSPPDRLGLNAVARITTSATDKLGGAYSRQGLNEIIANKPAAKSDDLEDLYRS